jgi:hypothetical protein
MGINNKNNYNENNKQCIISSKNKKIYCDNEANIYIDQNKNYNEKELITISPGGFKGFYLLGISTFIKEKFDTDNIIYSGASAGAWNSLFMCYKGEPLAFIYDFIDDNIIKAKSITELQYFMKYKLLSKYKDNDFDLDKLFIGVTTIKNFKPCINIFTDFENLEDAINCCIASSHVPLITGGITNKYKNIYSFDGGFSNYPYLNKKNILHISPDMWNEYELNEKNNNIINRNINKIKNYLEIFSVSKNNILELLDNGYHDANKNKECLSKNLKYKKIIHDD